MVAHNPLTPKEHRSAYRRAELPRRGATRLYQGTHSFRVGKNLKGLLKLLKETIRDNIGHMLMITAGQGAPPGPAPPSPAPCPTAAGWHQAPQASSHTQAHSRFPEYGLLQPGAERTHHM